MCGPALTTRVDAACGRARALTLTMPHGAVLTPVFMPVGTQGTVKGMTSAEMQLPPLDVKILLGNTYHLGNRPGPETMAAAGGLHAFMGWPRCILTDSGGFQMVSLLHLAAITEAGVTFQSPVDGSEMLLTPEMSMQLQNGIGADIMMALDDVVDSKTVDDARFTEACHRTLRWIDRCIAAHARPTEQNLFGIVQGGLDTSPGGLRDVCVTGMLLRDASLPGYAIGGLAGGEDKAHFWRVVDYCARRLPAHKPRYLMGVGYPLDLVLCTALGVDMYDCVYPTRTARFGTALVHAGLIKLKASAAASDARPIDPTCPCYVCTTYTRSYLHLLLKNGDGMGAQLVTYHNLAYMMRLIREMRQAITEGNYAAYVQGFVQHMFPGDSARTPVWVRECAAAAGIDIMLPAPAHVAAAFAATPTADATPSADGDDVEPSGDRAQRTSGTAATASLVDAAAVAGVKRSAAGSPRSVPT